MKQKLYVNGKCLGFIASMTIDNDLQKSKDGVYYGDDAKVEIEIEEETGKDWDALQKEAEEVEEIIKNLPSGWQFKTEDEE